MSGPPPWSRVTIRRFRGLRDVSLEDLGTLNVFVGANDTGKTSLLEAMFLLSGSGNLFLPIDVQGFRDYTVGDFDGLSYLFYECDTATRIKLSAQTVALDSRRELSITALQRGSPGETVAAHGQGSDSHGSVSAAAQFSTDFAPDIHNRRYDLTISSGEDTSSYSGTLSLRNGEPVVNMKASLRKTTIRAGLLSDRSNHDASAIGRVIVNKKKHELLKYLRFVNSRVQDIGVHGSRAFLDIGLAGMLPINMFGSGMIRACSIIAHCVLGPSRIFLIDEVSSGLHYKALLSLLRAMLRLSIQNGVQVFATTHSLSVLQGLQEILGREEMADARDALACYALQRDHGGEVRAYRYGHRDLDHCIRHGIEIR